MIKTFTIAVTVGNTSLLSFSDISTKCIDAPIMAAILKLCYLFVILKKLTSLLLFYTLPLFMCLGPVRKITNQIKGASR